MAELVLVARPKEELLAEFDDLDSAIEDAAVEPTWRLAYWLAANVPNDQGARNDLVTRETKLTLDELAKRSERGRPWLNTLRKTAVDFPPGVALDGVSVKVHATAMGQAKGDREAALEAIKAKGPRLRDQTPGQDIESARRILENPDTRKAVIDRLDPVVVSQVGVAVARRQINDEAIARENAGYYPTEAWEPPPIPVAVLLARVNDGFREIMRDIRSWSFGVQELAPTLTGISDYDRAAIIELMHEAEQEFESVRKVWLV